MRLIVFCCLLGWSLTMFAHDQIPGTPQRQPIAITGATIHVVDGPVIHKGTVLFADGVITAVGQAIEIPTDTIEIDGTGKHVYPGLIEAMTDLGLREISAVEETLDKIEYGEVNPNVRSWVAVNPDSELIPVARANGVLFAVPSPAGSFIRGQSALMQLDGWTAQEMTVRAPVGLFVNGNKLDPRADDDATRVEQREVELQRFDGLLDEARRYLAVHQARPGDTPTDLRLESLGMVVRGEIPLIVDADRRSSIEAAVAYARGQGLQLVIFGGYDAVACSELLRAHNVPVIVAGTHRLPLRRDDPYDASYTLPARLQKAGIKYAIASDGNAPDGSANTRNLPYHAASAVAFGLTDDQAIRAITLSTAEILGVADRIGSLTVGKDATLVIVDGDILQTESNVTTAYIQGRQVDLGSRHKTL